MFQKITVPALAAAACIMTASAPANAIAVPASAQTAAVETGAGEAWQHGRSRSRSDHRHGSSRTYYDEPIRADTRVWRGRDGRYHCRKKDGTTGLIIGGAVGALLGREIDGGYNRSLGTILGAAGGALLGREVARGGGRCR